MDFEQFIPAHLVQWLQTPMVWMWLLPVALLFAMWRSLGRWLLWMMLWRIFWSFMGRRGMLALLGVISAGGGWRWLGH